MNDQDNEHKNRELKINGRKWIEREKKEREEGRREDLKLER